MEAAIDVEWASAAAPNAAIVNAACADTAQFGGFLALANLLQEPNPPTVVSISYGESEASEVPENLYINDLYQTAVAEGVSVFVSSGDEDAASSDNGNVSTHGITISGFTSTPYNISVGGTDSGSHSFAQPAPTSVPPTGPTSKPPCPTFPKFHGTIPAPEFLSPPTSACRPPGLTACATTTAAHLPRSSGF